MTDFSYEVRIDMRARNFSYYMDIFKWLIENDYPHLVMSRPADNSEVTIALSEASHAALLKLKFS